MPTVSWMKYRGTTCFIFRQVRRFYAFPIHQLEENSLINCRRDWCVYMLPSLRLLPFAATNKIGFSFIWQWLSIGSQPAILNWWLGQTHIAQRLQHCMPITRFLAFHWYNQSKKSGIPQVTTHKISATEKQAHTCQLFQALCHHLPCFEPFPSQRVLVSS